MKLSIKKTNTIKMGEGQRCKKRVYLNKIKKMIPKNCR